MECKTQEPDATVYSHTDTHTQGASMSRFIRTATALTLGASTLASLPALAADELHYNQISLRAEVSQEVARDLMIVTLYTEAQNTDPAKLAAEITTTMNKALAQAREVKA
jgi:predicted secreted protein